MNLTFSALLDALNSAPLDRRPAIEQLIREMFWRRKAVLALDMSGFTLTVRRDGIISYLGHVRRMHRLTMPIAVSHHGEIVKCEADNLLAVFDDPEQAVAAAVAMNLAALTEPANDRHALTFSIGIDYGELLLLDGIDCFGDPVNLAYKLGEDLARPGEVLITRSVRERLGDGSRFALREMPLSISGVELSAYGVLYGDTEAPP